MLILHIIPMYLSQNNFTEHDLNKNIIVLRPYNTSIIFLHVRKTIKLSLIYVRGSILIVNIKQLTTATTLIAQNYQHENVF